MPFPPYDRGFHDGVKTLCQAVYKELYPDSPHTPEAGSDAMIIATRAWVRFAIDPLKDKHPAGSPPMKPSPTDKPNTSDPFITLHIPSASSSGSKPLNKKKPHPLQALILARYHQLLSEPGPVLFTPREQTVSDSLSVEGVRDLPPPSSSRRLFDQTLPNSPLTAFRHLNQKSRVALCKRVLATL